MMEKSELVIYDSLGNQLYNGDNVLVIRDLKVKGSKNKLKRGAKLKNIKLNKGMFSIQCFVDSIGKIELKTESVKKI